MMFLIFVRRLRTYFHVSITLFNIDPTHYDPLSSSYLHVNNASICLRFLRIAMFYLLVCSYQVSKSGPHLKLYQGISDSDLCIQFQ